MSLAAVDVCGQDPFFNKDCEGGKGCGLECWHQ